MTNFRQLPKNGLIREIKVRQKAIQLFCKECISGVRKQDCQTEDCYLFSFRPWNTKQIQVPLIAKK